MQAYYLKQHRAELPDDGFHWLSPAEARVLDGFRITKRREDWLLGRWTAKLALTRFPSLPERSLKDWQIVADPDGAPAVFLDKERLDVPITLSHSGSTAFCVLTDASARLGCDLEKIEQRSRSFEETFFTEQELSMLDENPCCDRATLVTLVWSAKECVLKAIREGLRADTRRVVVTAIGTGKDGHWSRLEASDRDVNDAYHGWWKVADGMVYAVLSDCSFPPPLVLPPPNNS